MESTVHGLTADEQSSKYEGEGKDDVSACKG